MWALAMTWEVLKFNPLRLFRRGKGGGKHRDTLAKPARRPERVVRDVRNKRKAKSDPSDVKLAPAADNAATQPVAGHDRPHDGPPSPHLDRVSDPPQGTDVDNGEGKSAEAASK